MPKRRGKRPAPPPQPIVRGPAVQGTGAPSQERRESPDAGQKGARTVEGPGAEGPSGPQDAAPEPARTPEGRDPKGM